MIRKQELIDAIGDLGRDVFNLSIRLSNLEKELKEIKKRASKKEEDELEKAIAIARAKSPKKRGRPAGSGKKASK